ncbi:PfkB family carbohydrate kinase [Anoxynatronum buryatiense]|uniref:Sugar or nucleoside kinase, ribokinase family n=1 Tax=Anoxynatronum buryatiense TaxID=489973 RepID=A0AA45WY72_9CLOT|nr:PfkB family carbohydrate kinase [Anoxynatronum buryatiense]SMP67362.1 Sugar or nucleoside kinase, ribokinase family [Anoxynatronum buryatiense]
MKKRNCDTFIIGHVSLDCNIYQGQESRSFGGAVVYSSHAAVAGGWRVGVLTKTSEEDQKMLETIFNVPKENLFHTASPVTTSIRNEYLTEDRERRICTALRVAAPFTVADLPPVTSRIYHLGGLIAGDFDPALLPELASRGKLAVDAQAFLRRNEGGSMVFRDWEEKRKWLPYIDYLKTDAAEAEIMTGETDRSKAAKVLLEWGAKEVMITHNTEVLVQNRDEGAVVPLKPRNLTGRTGRGDSCFSAYITERLEKSVLEAARYAAALVSLKMEKPEPFKGNRQEVENYLQQFY